MIGSTLNRMIFWELVKVFLLSLGSLTGLFLMVGVAQQASQLGLTAGQVMWLLPLLVPNTLPYTIPATTLFAACVVYGRLAHDNEIVAVKAAGVRLFVILKPAVLLGLLTTFTTLGLYHTVIPRTQQMLQQTVLKDPEEVLYNLLRRERCFRHPTFPYVMYVKDVQGRRLVDVVLKRRAKLAEGKNGAADVWLGYDFVARAREARLRVDVEQGVMYIDPDRFVIYDKTTTGTTLSNHPFPVPLPDNMSGKESKNRVTTLTWDDLGPRAAELKGVEEAVKVRRAEAMAAANALPAGPQKDLALTQDANFKAQLELAHRQYVNVAAEFHMRPALAFGCLAFALIGCPVGIWANRSDYLSTFVICFLPTVFAYYPLLLAGSNMGKDGKVPLWAGVWLANAVVGAIGVGLTLRLLRR